MNIAVDGPSGSGKSTVSKALAINLNLAYLDTGAMYRAVTAWLLGDSTSLDSNWQNMLTKKVNLNINPDAAAFTILIDEHDVTEEIRSQRVTDTVSLVAAEADVRDWMVQLQREIMNTSKGIVMEGRDIGTVVMPDAEVKIFVTADLTKRAERRAKEMAQQSDFTQQSLSSRDEKDSNRIISPLLKAADAVDLDTTFLSIEESIEAALTIVKRKSNV
ncbi:MAG: (d)CMP kinase [Candidatus Nanopelagicales bacterium]